MTARRDVDWDELVAGAEPAELRAGRGHRPAVRALHVGHDRQAQGHRARQRRPRGGAAVVAWRTSTTWAAARSGGPPPTSAGSSGHSYIVYAPLLVGATTVLYEGKPVGTPDAGAFWRVVAEHGVQGAVHGADRDPGDQEGRPRRRAAGGYDVSSLRTLFLAGERLDPDT